MSRRSRRKRRRAKSKERGSRRCRALRKDGRGCFACGLVRFMKDGGCSLHGTAALSFTEPRTFDPIMFRDGRHKQAILRGSQQESEQ